MITILFISPHSDGYGADISLAKNIIYLKKIGAIYPIIILKKKGRIEKLLAEYEIEYYIIDFKMLIKGYKFKRIEYLKLYLKNIYNYVSILRIILKIWKRNVKIVYTNSLGTDIGIKISKVFRIPHIQHIREILREGFGFELEMNENYYYEYIGSNSSVILCNSFMTIEYFKYILPEDKLIFIPNPILEGVIPKFIKRKINIVKFIVISRLMDDKGITTILDACIKLKEKNFNFKLDFYGSGILKDFMIQTITENSLSKFVEIKEYLETSSSTISQYDVGILGSKMESFGRVIIEYMSAGLPVICTHKCGAGYLIKDSMNGFKFTFGDNQKLSEIMSHCIANKEDLSNLGLNALNSLDDTFTIENSSSKLLEVYERVLDQY